MEQEIAQALGAFLPPEALPLAAQMFRPAEARRDTYLLAAGQRCRYVYLLVKGSARMSYIADGREHIGDFFVEGDFVTDYSSFLTQTPSHLNLICCEDCSLLVLEYDTLQQAYADYPQWTEPMGRRLAEQNCIVFARRIWSSLTDSPTRRYQLLLAEKPHWFRRFPQYMIASYLGLTPEGLSKLRRRLAQGAP
ncbi:MAG: Crp/Fnr family transcriptional regulator [Bacteroidia bacterium]